MSTREAVKLLQNAGWKFLRHGRGCHIILRKGEHTLVLSDGQTQLSLGMQAKVRTMLRKK